MKRVIFGALLAAALAQGLPAYNRKANGVMEISLASPIPANTDWGKALAQVAQEWKRVSGGKINVRIFANSVLGDERAVIQQMDSGVLDGAVLSSFGLNAITKKPLNVVTRRPSPPSPALITLSCPLLIRDEEELGLVMKSLKPDLEKKINEKGYYTIAWAKVGWAKIFSRQPVRTPEDLRKIFLGTPAGEDDLKEVLEKMGFKLRLVEQKDLLQALTTRTVEAVYQSPISAGGQQLVGAAPNMTDMNIAPFMGGIVLNQKTWDDIPAEYKPALLEATGRIAEEMDRTVRDLESGAVALIQAKMKNKFRVIELDDSERRQWYALVQAALHDDPATGRKGLVGTTFDRAVYEKIAAIVEAHRAGAR